MFKNVLLVLVLGVFLISFVGCSAFTCEDCGEQKSGKSHKVQFLKGYKTETICEDCFSKYGNIGKMIEVK